MARTKKQTLKSEETSGLRELFITELKDIYWAENALVKALPKMAKKADSPELVAAIEDHLAVTENHVDRLEKVFDLMGKAAKGEKCEAMAGLVKEAEDIAGEFEEGVVRDAAIIAASQKIEHYEIASYGTLVAFATILGENEVAEQLEMTLNEEKEADQLLSSLAESYINAEAAGEEAEEE